MSRVPVLRELRVSCNGATVHLAWRWAGDSPPQVRVLRSAEWFCDSPDSHLTGEWSQELVYEGEGRQLLDAQACSERDLFYSIFARRGRRGAWRAPVRICVRKTGYEPPALGVAPGAGTAADELYAPGRLIGERYVEISGSQEEPPMVGGSREWLLVALPAATLGLLMGFLGGLDVRLLTVAALGLALCWRLLDGAHPDLKRFLAYLRVVAVVDGFFWVAALLILRIAAVLPTDLRINNSILLFWLYPMLLLTGMAGVWLFAGRTLNDEGHPTRLGPLALLAGLIALAAVLPPVACALAGAFAVYDYVHTVRATREQQAARLRELRSTDRRIKRETYTPWLPDDEDS